MTEHDLKLLKHKSIYSVGDYKIKRIFSIIESIFSKSIIVFCIFLLLLIYGHISFMSGNIQRPLKHVYFFIPVNKQEKALEWTKYESFKEISPDSIKSYLKGK